MSGLSGLSRKEREAASRQIEKVNAKYPEHLIEIPQDQWPPCHPGAEGPFKVMRSRNFLVQFYFDRTRMVRLSIQRTKLNSTGRFSADISWDDLQRLKAQAGYADFDAVELFPRQQDVVNVSNMRHLWVLMGGVAPFGWRNSP